MAAGRAHDSGKLARYFFGVGKNADPEPVPAANGGGHFQKRKARGKLEDMRRKLRRVRLCRYRMLGTKARRNNRIL